MEKENVDLAKTMALSQREQQDAAMAAERNITHGGIDLNTSNGMQWEINKDGQGVEMNIDPAMLAQLQNAPGFVPVIISIQPLKSLPEFLGLNQPQAST